jgi:hypothetical protein
LPVDHDGLVVGDLIIRTRKLTGCQIERAYVDKGYRGPRNGNLCPIFISSQKRDVFGFIKANSGDAQPWKPATRQAQLQKEVGTVLHASYRIRISGEHNDAPQQAVSSHDG